MLQFIKWTYTGEFVENRMVHSLIIYIAMEAVNSNLQSAEVITGYVITHTPSPLFFTN